MDLTNVQGAFVAFVLAAGPLAVGVNHAVDWLRNLIDPRTTQNPAGRFPSVVWTSAGFVFGIALCVGWQFNPVAGLAEAIPAMQGSTRLSGVAGQVLSGLVLGAMAGFWHDKRTAWSAPTANIPPAGG